MEPGVTRFRNALLSAQGEAPIDWKKRYTEYDRWSQDADKFREFCNAQGWRSVGDDDHGDWAVSAYQIDSAGETGNYGLLAMSMDGTEFVVALAREPDGVTMSNGQEDYYTDPNLYTEFYRGDLAGMEKFVEQNQAEFHKMASPKSVKYRAEPGAGSLPRRGVPQAKKNTYRGWELSQQGDLWVAQVTGGPPFRTLTAGSLQELKRKIDNA